MTNDSTPTLVEIALEREKLALERERLVLERQRLENQRDSDSHDSSVLIQGKGKFAVPIPIAILIGILCLLTGILIGLYSEIVRREHQTERNRQALIRSFSAAGTNLLETTEVPGKINRLNPDETDNNVFFFVE